MENTESFISDAERNFITAQQEEMHSIQESGHEATSEVYFENLRLLLQSDPRHALHSEVLFPTSFIPQYLTLSHESTNQGVPEELVICGYHLLNLRSDLLHTSESGSAGLTNPRPLPTHGFLDIGETGIVWNESQELFRWRFDICPHEAEDIICILSPSFTTQFGDRVYIRLYINSDCTRYRANATSIFLVTVAKAKNSLSSLVTNVFRSHNYFNLSPLDSKNAFSLGRKDNIVQAVHGLQEFVPTTELAQSTTGGTICLGVQFIV